MTPQKIQKQKEYPFRFSICTLVNRAEEYAEMVDSFVQAGFAEEDCEFLYADNSTENEFEAFGGINRFLQEARGKYVIICHQDILISLDDRKKLEQQISLVDSLDSNWAVLGNAGSVNLYAFSMVVTEADMKTYRSGVMPAKVHSLDENFLIVKASANLAVSGDLNGFHLYGTEICLVAECLGYSAWTIDFNLVHKGLGIVDQSFHDLSDKLQRKYRNFFRGRYIRTTITRFYLSSSRLMSFLMSFGFVKTLFITYHKFQDKKRLSLAGLFFITEYI